MNCRPDDLAVVVRSVVGDRCGRSHIGMVVTVGRVAQDLFGPSWTIKGRPRCRECGGQVFYILDADLQPIRPQAMAVGAPVLVGVEVLTEQPA